MKLSGCGPKRSTLCYAQDLAYHQSDERVAPVGLSLGEMVNIEVALKLKIDKVSS